MWREARKFCNAAAAMKKEKCRINIDKPINIGTRVLNLCEGLMQDFHYNYIKNDYGDKPGMLLTDTDNHMYESEAENVYENF